MKAEVQVELISEELIKPLSPTPNHLRHLQLSFLDQVQPPVWMPFVLFYPQNPKTTPSQICTRLKKSLSETLTIFYPLAGRDKGKSYIDCNDEGVLFVEAQANCVLFDVLKNRDPSDNTKFIPLPLDDGKELGAFCQITFFKCGGLAISFAMSHKLGDALSKLIFINCWAAITRGDRESEVTKIPPFGTSTLFPPKDMGSLDPRSWIRKEKIVTKTLLFDNSTIEVLRSKLADKNGVRVSRVEALAGFIWRRYMASAQANDRANKLYVVNHAVNLRPRMDPPLSNRYFGNINRNAIAQPNMEAKEDECYEIVTRMRGAIREMNPEFVKSLQKSDGHLNLLKEKSQQVLQGEVISFTFSSLCKFPIYEIDFGWGKPEWVGSARLVFKNLVIFFDTKEGQGIEAWINLREEEMAKFEIDNELLAHVSNMSDRVVSPSETVGRSRL